MGLNAFPWTAVQDLVQQDLSTLEDWEPFRLLSVSSDVVTIRLGNGHQKLLHKPALETAWFRLQGGAELTLAELHALQPKRQSYLAAILVKLPDIEYAVNPIRLFKRTIPAVAQKKRVVRSPATFRKLVLETEYCPFLIADKRDYWFRIVRKYNGPDNWQALDDYLTTSASLAPADFGRKVLKRLRRDVQEYKSSGHDGTATIYQSERK